MGHKNYYGPGVPSLTAKANKQWTPKQVSQETVVERNLKRRERFTNTHSAGLPTYGGGTPIPCRVLPWVSPCVPVGLAGLALQ